MAIKVIVELQAQPGRRAELKSLFESIVAKQGPGQRCHSYMLRLWPEPQPFGEMKKILIVEDAVDCP